MAEKYKAVWRYHGKSIEAFNNMRTPVVVKLK